MQLVRIETENIGTYTLKYQFKGKILCQYSVNALLIFSFVSSVIQLTPCLSFLLSHRCAFYRTLDSFYLASPNAF